MNSELRTPRKSAKSQRQNNRKPIRRGLNKKPFILPVQRDLLAARESGRKMNNPREASTRRRCCSAMRHGASTREKNVPDVESGRRFQAMDRRTSYGKGATGMSLSAATRA